MQQTAFDFRFFDWSSDVCSADLTELDPHLSYAKVAEGCRLKGVTVKTQAALTEALQTACKAQADGVTTFIEVILNQELGEPFRRDAMKKPVAVAGIDPKRSEEHTSELQSLMRISYAVFCLKKKKKHKQKIS